MNKEYKELHLNRPSDYSEFIYRIKELIKKSGLTEDEWFNKLNKIAYRDNDRY